MDRPLLAVLRDAAGDRLFVGREREARHAVHWEPGELLGVVGTSRDVRPPDPGSGSLAGLATFWVVRSLREERMSCLL